MKRIYTLLQLLVMGPLAILGQSVNVMSGEKPDLPQLPLSFYGDIALNPFVQPYYLTNETFNLNYYGSGDVNNDGKIDWTDYNTILSNPSDRSDLNGDGVTNDSDKQLLYQYLTDQIPYLPAHWDYLQNRLERISWFEKVKAIDQTQVYHPGWNCTNYSMQFQINTAGVENISGSGLGSTYDISKNARFNIPVYRVNDETNTGVDHWIDAISIGDTTGNFSSWYFYEPQNDNRVYPSAGPGTTSMGLNSYVNIQRLAYYYNQPFSQYTYGDLEPIDFQLNNGQPIVTFIDPDAVLNRTLKNIHLHGNKPLDATVNWANGQALTDPDHTGWPINVSPPGTQMTRSDSSTQSSGTWDPSTYNYYIYRDWKLRQDTIIDTTLGSRRGVFWNNGRPPQIIQVQDIEPPVVSWTPNGQTYYYSQYIQNGIPPVQATDNCGVWAVGRTMISNQVTDPTNCNYYEFTVMVKDSLYDPSGNNTIVTSNVSIIMDPTTWTYIPPQFTLNWPASTDPSNTGGYATATNPSGVQVTVTYSDISSQNPDPGQCGHYDFGITRTWLATTNPCNHQITATQLIYMQAINAPTLTFVPADTIIPMGSCSTPECLGMAQGVDNQTGMPVTPQSYDSILYQGSDSIIFDRHHYVTTLCNIESQQGIQTVREINGLGIAGTKANRAISIYPNPTTGLATLSFYIPQPEQVEIRIADLTGKLLQEYQFFLKTPGIQCTTIILTDYQAGTYLLTLDLQSTIAVFRLVKWEGR